MDYIKGLNDKQKEAVLHGEGPLLILAGAGSGKTRVLTHRIAYLVKEKGIFPSNILSITFTNKAANEMNERIESLMDEGLSSIWSGTFHSICVRILRMNIEKIGYSSSFTIYDRNDQLTVVKESIKLRNISTDMYKPKTVLNAIARLKEARIKPKDYIKENYSKIYERTIGELYESYENILKSNNALDFDDLILKTVELLEKDEEVLGYYSRKFKYIFVDEFQDTNGPQYDLIKLLSSHYKNLCVVGDDDQSIYGFRGADIKNILNFEKDFENTKIIKLEQNYRSTKNILTAANNVIKNNFDRKQKELWTANDSGDKVIVESVDDSQEEADFVAGKIRELINENDYNLSDFAVLYRTNAQSRNFEDAFMKRNMPYKLVGGVRFYDRMEIKDITYYLNLIQNPNDDVSFKRVINVPKRGIGNATIEKIETYANKTGESLYSAILSADDIEGLSTRARNNLNEFTDIINNLIVQKELFGVQEFIETVIENVGYIEELEKDKSIESQTRIDNIREFISVAVDFEMKNPEGNIEDFLSSVSLLSDVDKTEEVDDSITMITVHSSKGLEYPVVFLVGMEEGLFPSFRSLEDDKSIEEERRLCYVAMTRAEEKLFITFAKLRTIYGRTNYSIPSRFIDELPSKEISTNYNKNIKRVRPKKKEDPIDISRNKFKRNLELIKEEAKRRKENIKTDSDYTEGDRVRHRTWGVGTIAQIKDRGKDKELIIVFEGVGIKRILESIAPIEKI